MIAFNEEAVIADALASVSWADEIIVVDSGSTDQTVNIAKRYTERVLFRPWMGFSAQKNWAVDQATHDWVLSLDADERITPGLRDEIVALLQGPPSCAGFYIARKNFFLGQWIRHGGWFPDKTLRLFDKRQGRFGDRIVHEKVEVKGEVGHLRHPMIHYTYTSLSSYHRRAGRYAGLAAEEMHAGGRAFSIMDILVRPLWTFVRMYLFQQGFRDGIRGFLLAVFYGYYTFLKYARLWELRRT